MRLKIISFILFLTLISCQSNSNLKLPSLISDNMLLQQKTAAKIWGKANPGNKISVSASWNAKGQSITGKDGNATCRLASERHYNAFVSYDRICFNS